MPAPTEREEKLLLAMYAQMWANINRHVLIIWQSITAIVGALALLGLVAKNVIGLDMSTTLIAVVAAWLLAHTYDSSIWFNRNQYIVSAIERELLSEDLRVRIHPVIGVDRPPNKMILQFRIQQVLALAIWVGILAHHFVDRVLPGFAAPLHNFQIARAAPYVVSFLGAIAIGIARQQAYAEPAPKPTAAASTIPPMQENQATETATVPPT